MKCDFCGLPKPETMFIHPVRDGTPWAACMECHLLITGGHFLPLVQRAVAGFVSRAPRAAGQTAITEELRRQTERWLHDQFWFKRNGAAWPHLSAMRLCAHCGATVRAQDDPCPHCGEPV